MHVYLKNGTQRKWLIVQLDEGHVPRIAGFPVNETNEVSSTLEPAIWFKLMVLDSVSVDCEKHVVCWTTMKDDVENEESQGKEHLMFTDEDQYCYDFDDDLDELFNLAMYLINTNPMAELNKNRRTDLVQEYQRSLFRLLHCYILGKVELHPEDTRQVMQAHQLQLRAISQADDEVMMHKRIVEQYINQMREIREKEILPFYNEVMNQSLHSKDFVEMLKNDLLNDLEKVRDEVDSLQVRVDMIKLDINKGETNKLTQEALAIARSKRDVAVRRLSQLLEWREMVLCHEKQTTKKPQQQPLAPVFIKYLGFNEQVKKEKELTLDVCHKKVRAVSVRECIESTLNDLEKGETSVGEEMTVDGRKPTNVITDIGCNSEWQTLNERLATVVHNSEHPVGRAFSQFTGEIRQRCGEIFRAYERLSDKNAIAEIDGYLIVGSDEFPFDEDILNGLKDRIRDHFQQITCLLMEIFGKQSPLFWRKLWLSYEKVFFHHVGDYLVRLYRLVNSRAMIDLEKRVSRLRDFPVCKLGLQMKEEWWLSLFEPTDGPALHRIKSENSRSHLKNGGKFSSDLKLRNSESYGDDFEVENRKLDQFYNNMEFMKEKLQAGAEKVLSRSWSCYDVTDGETKFDPVRDGALAMVQDISSKVAGARNFISYSRIFGTEESRNGSGYFDKNKDTGRRSRSRSCSDILSTKNNSFYEHDSKRVRLSTKRRDTFERHFGGVLTGFRDVFQTPSPLKKMQCLSASLRIMARNVMELRQRKHPGSGDADAISHAVTAEDLLPLIVLMLLKLKPVEVGKLYIEMCFISDMMADFLSSGCHSYALTEFQMAFRVLSQTCDELEINLD